MLIINIGWGYRIRTCEITGSEPVDLPLVQSPSKYYFTINIKERKEKGLKNTN